MKAAASRLRASLAGLSRLSPETVPLVVAVGLVLGVFRLPQGRQTQNQYPN